MKSDCTLPHEVPRNNQKIVKELQTRKKNMKSKPIGARSHLVPPLLVLLCVLLLLPGATASKFDVGNPCHGYVIPGTMSDRTFTRPFGPPNSTSPHALAAMATAGSGDNCSVETFDYLRTHGFEGSRLHYLALVGLPTSSLVSNLSDQAVGLPTASYDDQSDSLETLVSCSCYLLQNGHEGIVGVWYPMVLLLMTSLWICGLTHNPKKVSPKVSRKSTLKKSPRECAIPERRPRVLIICQECRWIGLGKGHHQRKTQVRFKARDRAWRLVMERQSWKVRGLGASDEQARRWARLPRRTPDGQPGSAIRPPGAQTASNEAHRTREGADVSATPVV